MMHSRPPTNTRHRLKNNDLYAKIIIYYDYYIDFVSRTEILCPHDNYSQRYTIRKLLLIYAYDDADDTRICQQDIQSNKDSTATILYPTVR